MPAILLLLLLTSLSAQAANSCVVLQYHHFSHSTPRITSVTAQQFDAHLDYLAANDFHVMALRDVVLSLQHQIELPEKCVSFSIDDAYISI
jgi:peptidoglycan/xylan/chitin deacetylase (PgdA/CDA1 family)